MATLRGSIADAINELNKLLVKTSDPEEKRKIRKLRKIYVALFEEVIKQEITARHIKRRWRMKRWIMPAKKQLKQKRTSPK